MFFFLQAKHIEFNPIRGDDVHLPDGIVFVIANSLVGFTFKFPLNPKDCRACFSVNSEKLEQNIPPSLQKKIWWTVWMCYAYELWVRRPLQGIT